MTKDEFKIWAVHILKIEANDPGFQTWVETNIRNIQITLQEHELLNRLQIFIASHQAGPHKTAINIVGNELKISTKEFSSVLSKLYRANILENKSFPEPSDPSEGWINSTNLYGRINDLVRTTIVCRHLDEPRRVANELINIAKATGISARQKAQAKESGYYAYHVYFRIPVQLVDRKWGQFSELVDFEIQITTQMQHMLYELTHVFYDNERDQISEDENSWKWDYRSPKFSASYLSHTLHLLEGMIISLYEDMENRVAKTNQSVTGESEKGS